MNDSEFGHYTLSDDTLNKLSTQIYPNNVDFSEIKLWKTVAQEIDENMIVQENDRNERENDEPLEKSSSDIEIASQFYFSQSSDNAMPTASETARDETSINKDQDVSKLLQEFLEQPNGAFDLNLLKGLTLPIVAQTLDNLNQHLTMTGLLNVLKAMNEFNSEEIIAYMDIICDKLILTKLSEIGLSERMIRDSIVELTKKYPEQVQRTIYIPSLNHDLTSDCVILDLIEALGPDKNDALLLDFTTHVNEIKRWHFSVIQKLISTPMNETSKNLLVQMFLDKSTVFSDSTDFGKLLVAFITAGAPFDIAETSILKEIADAHNTSLKRPLNNVVKKLKNYVH